MKKDEILKTADDLPMSPIPGRISIFLAGACSMLLVVSVLGWGLNTLNFLSPMKQQLAASLTSVSSTPSEKNFHAPLLTEQLVVNSPAWSLEQLDKLVALPPHWSLHYGHQLLVQANEHWPKHPAVAQMQKNWQRHAEQNMLHPSALSSWQVATEKLQLLTDKLNSLNEKRGQSMTVSELKSAVLSITQTLHRYPPVEAQLWQLHKQQSWNASAAALQRQTELHLKQLVASYYLLKPVAD